MYRVTVVTDGQEYLLHDPRDEEMQFISADLAEEVGKSETFTFAIPPTHPNKDKIVPFASEITIWRDKAKLCRCRMISSQSDFYNTGQGVCEGLGGYLLDSVQRPYEFSGHAGDLFARLIGIHNGQVDDYKRVEAGRFDPAGEVTRSNAEYVPTLNEMNNAFCIDKDYFLHVRYGDDGKRYLDCVKDYGGTNKQQIRFGVNLVSLDRHVDPQTLVTVLIPTGEDAGDAAGNGERKPTDVTSVNGGRDYVVHEAAAGIHGMIWGQVKFDGVTDPGVLLAKAKAYLDEAAEMREAIEAKAVDLSLVDEGEEPFRVGYWTDVVSKPHGLDTRMLLARMTISLTDPRKCEMSLGSVRPKFTGMAAKNKAQTSARIASVAASSSKEINRKVENATNLITGGLGGYVVLDVDDPDTGKRALPWRILVMDAPVKEDAHDVIQINKNGLGFSTTGIDGPYRNAWTIDGNLVADFITSGQMLADRIRGGVLEVGGSGLARDGRIVIKDAGDSQIGYWDKTGLHVFLGVIEGTDVVGGSVNIGDGTFTVDKNGDVMINSGSIRIGNVWINPSYAYIKGFGIADAVLYSRDKGNSIEICTGEWIEWKKPHIKVENEEGGTHLGPGTVATDIVYCRDVWFNDPWVNRMSLIDMLKDLYNKINRGG